jgi:hypothetical protein
LLLAGAGAGCLAAAADKPASPVRTVLQKEAYPWYDGGTDQVKPLVYEQYAWIKWLGDRIGALLDWLEGLISRSPRGAGHGLGGFIPTFLFLLFGGALMIILWRLWRQSEPRQATPADAPAQVGSIARLAGLAPGVSLEGKDPWAEALARRAAGDRAGAVIWLFFYQLLTLNRLGLVRLAPGRTARQYVFAVADPLLREGLEATLGLFEEAYYGHRVPTASALEAVWSRALAFRRHLEAIKATQ